MLMMRAFKAKQVDGIACSLWWACSEDPVLLYCKDKDVNLVLDVSSK